MTQASTAPVRLALTRHHVKNPHAVDRRALLLALAAQLPCSQEGERSIVVNVGEPGTERVVLFCSANVTPDIVAADTVVVDVAVDSAYRTFVRSVIASATSTVLALREALRSVPLPGMGAPCQQLCQQLDVIALMTEGYGLQSGDSGQQALAGGLAAASQRLRESVTATDDNVRCMDDLHYDVSPALHAVDETFRRQSITSD